MRYGSVCSGIEAASIAWHPLGWRASWLSEIEAFPSAVLAHHYPEVPNLGDLKKIAKRVMTGDVDAPDILVGGTPCQAFSVAGLRQSLSDERGNLSLKFVELADAIDHVRSISGRAPAIIVWENVPGVLSTSDNAFGCFLGALAGEDCELQPAGKRWSDAGCVYGPSRAVAWRILDAQYFGLAQRRRRVFVVASARNGFDPAAVLFERDSVRRDHPPSREAREDTAAGTLRSTDGGSDVEPGRAGHLIPQGCGGEVAPTLNAAFGSKLGLDNQHIDSGAGLFVTHTLRGEGFDASEDGTGRGTPLVPVAFSIMPMNSGKDYKARPVEVAQPLMAGGPVGGNQGGDFIVQPVAYRTTGNNGCYETGDQVGALTCSTDPNAQIVAFSCKDHGADAGDIAPTLRAMGHGASHANAGGQVAVAFQSSQSGVRVGEAHATLDSNNGSRRHNGVIHASAVRRLTPTECSRLQGFPDDYLELNYADADEAHAAQVLHELWRDAATPAIEEQGWRTGITAALLTPEILLAGVYGGWLSWQVAARCTASRGALQGEVYNHENFLRAMRINGSARCSPFRRESFEQCARELGSDLSLLPLESAQARARLRSSNLWPQAQARWPLRYALAKGKTRENLDRLNPDGPRYKALGNSMAVPVMAWIGRRIAAAANDNTPT